MINIASKDAADRLFVALGEQLAAARSHDPSEGHAQMLRGVLTHLGVENVDLGS